MSVTNWIGIVFRQWDDNANHFKYHVVVADKSGELATVYINTAVRYGVLPQTLQATQLPISQNDCTYLTHESFVDCSSIKEFNKSYINSYLQQNRGHNCGKLADDLMSKIIDILNRSKVIEIVIKQKYGFGY